VVGEGSRTRLDNRQKSLEGQGGDEDSEDFGVQSQFDNITSRAQFTHSSLITIVSP
jgi:hypothetical protein